jgi:hypothetical protein
MLDAGQVIPQRRWLDVWSPTKQDHSCGTLSVRLARGPNPEGVEIE